MQRGDIEHGIAWIRIDDDGEAIVAGGPAEGEQWPTGMLNGPVTTLNGVNARIITPEAQIEIKEMMPVWNPNVPKRSKDTKDLNALRAAMKTRR